MGLFESTSNRVSSFVVVTVAFALVWSSVSWGAGRKPARISDAESLASISSMLNSGMPTLVYVYYSVACSCTAAHCAVAEAALDSAWGEGGLKGKVNLLMVDAYQEESADTLLGNGFVPMMIYYDKFGKEASRIEWEISKKMVMDLFGGRAREDSE